MLLPYYLWWYSPAVSYSVQNHFCSDQFIPATVAGKHVYPSFCIRLFILLDSSPIICQRVVLGGISFLLPVYGIGNSERYSVFHSIRYSTVFDQANIQCNMYIIMSLCVGPHKNCFTCFTKGVCSTKKINTVIIVYLYYCN